nr:hypothetical protein [Tanacetum cinerariifolium]
MWYRAARTQQSTVEMHDADEEVARLYWSLELANDCVSISSPK